MKKRIIYSAFLIVIMSIFSSYISFAGENPVKVVKVKYAHIGPADTFNSFMHAGAVAFKYVMEKRSGGRFQVDIYPAGSLGKEIDLMEAVRNNVIQVHRASMGGLFRIFPAALLPACPYVFKNEAIGVKVIDGPFGRKLLDLFTERTGIIGLAISDSYAFMAITNNVRPLRTPADMNGLKFRGMDTMQVTMFNSLGASGIQLAWTDVYTGLQTGVINGQTNPPAIVKWGKVYEVQKYITITSSMFSTMWVTCNKQWYDGLSSRDKMIVKDATRADVIASRGLNMLLEPKSIDDLKELGMEVYVCSEQENSEFQKLARPAGIEWIKTKVDPKIVDEFLKVIDETGKKLGY